MRASDVTDPDHIQPISQPMQFGPVIDLLPRVLPDGIGASVNLASWQPPAVFGWLKSQAHVDAAEMLRTFNCGIGLVLVVAAAKADAVIAALKAEGEAPVIMGATEKGRGVKSEAKGKGEAEAVHYEGALRL